MAAASPSTSPSGSCPIAPPSGCGRRTCGCPISTPSSSAPSPSSSRWVLFLYSWWMASHRRSSHMRGPCDSSEDLEWTWPRYRARRRRPMRIHRFNQGMQSSPDK